MAAHFGTDSPKELEWRVDRRRPYGTEEDDPSLSNKYRRWRQGKSLPSDESVIHVAARSGGSVRLDFWRDMTLWELLAPELPPIQRLNEILENSPEGVRRILFGTAGRMGQFNHSTLSRDQTLAIRNHRSLPAFIALLCLARKGEVMGDGPFHFLHTACAFDLLPRVLYSHLPLRYRWEELYACLQPSYWRRIYGTNIYYDFPIETVRSSLKALDDNPSVELPRKSGPRYRVIGGDPIKAIEDRMARAVSVT